MENYHHHDAEQPHANRRIRWLPTDEPCISHEAKHDRWGEYRGLDAASRRKRKVVRFALDWQGKPLCTVHEIPCLQRSGFHSERTERAAGSVEVETEDLLLRWNKLDLSPLQRRTARSTTKKTSKDEVHPKRAGSTSSRERRFESWLKVSSFEETQPQDTGEMGAEPSPIPPSTR
ncbi:hypothetical protein ACA910_003763 [Epithemia clementina (nom. ined.)]